jgi:hypothetical protein
MDSDQRHSEIEYEIKLACIALLVCRQPAEQIKRTFKMSGCLGMSGSCNTAPAGAAPPLDCLIGQASLCEMMRQELRLRTGNIGEFLLKNSADPRVQLPAPAAQQSAVGSVPHKRVLEDVARLWWRAADK